MTITIESIVARWADPNARPLFKGRLIDEDGCCCAQGDVLRLCGWSDQDLRSAKQVTADHKVADALGISLAHAILLRQINDKVDGCPQDVLARPEKIIGDEAPRILAFWKLLDDLTPDQRAAPGTAVGAAWAAADAADAAWAAAWAAARAAAWAAAAAAGAAAKDAADAAGDAARAAADAAGAAAKDAADAAGDAARAAARAAVGATNEIQGAAHLSEFFFLPMFGINHPDELDD